MSQKIIPDIGADVVARPINRVAVIGAGTMGAGIAMCFVNADIPVVLLEINASALANGTARISENYAISVQRGKLTAEQVERRLSLITTSSDYAALADVDLVIEAVYENLDIKRDVFRKLDLVCKPGAILASNTSYQDINLIADVTSRPQDILGLHFFSPANVMRLLEVVRAAKTAPDVLLTVVSLAQAIGKIPVVSGVCWGFIANRMYEPFGREACRMLLEGATPSQIDAAHKKFGMAMGFCAVADLAGLDVIHHSHVAVAEKFAHDPSYHALIHALFERDEFGQKTGRGFYLYEGRNSRDNPDVMAIAAERARALGIAQREISDDEIIERCLFSLINEGARVLDEGIAYCAADIDTVFVNGYGFPATRVGPMHFANETGLDVIVGKLDAYRQRLGSYGEMWFQVAPSLRRLAEQGQRFL
ncbi:MAG: 3-hydroxyacyl-CoA dehydrogenase NAD-binding domain-containing protein [Spongiibacteraceae bacterium]